MVNGPQSACGPPRGGAVHRGQALARNVRKTRHGPVASGRAQFTQRQRTVACGLAPSVTASDFMACSLSPQLETGQLPAGWLVDDACQKITVLAPSFTSMDIFPLIGHEQFAYTQSFILGTTRQLAPETPRPRQRRKLQRGEQRQQGQHAAWVSGQAATPSPQRCAQAQGAQRREQQPQGPRPGAFGHCAMRHKAPQGKCIGLRWRGFPVLALRLGCGALAQVKGPKVSRQIEHAQCRAHHSQARRTRPLFVSERAHRRHDPCPAQMAREGPVLSAPHVGLGHPVQAGLALGATPRANGAPPPRCGRCPRCRYVKGMPTRGAMVQRQSIHASRQAVPRWLGQRGLAMGADGISAGQGLRAVGAAPAGDARLCGF